MIAFFRALRVDKIMSVYIYILLLIVFLRVILRVFKFVRNVVNTNDYKEVAIKNAHNDFIIFIGLFLFIWFIQELLNLLTIFFITPIIFIIVFIVVFKIFDTLVISGVGIIRLFTDSKIYMHHVLFK